MASRRSARSFLWALLLAVGCSGGANGFGCGSCFGPIPGGFPSGERQSEAASIKVSATGLQFAEDEARAIISQVASQTGGLVFDVPCVKNPVNVGFGQTIDVFACDLNNDQACDGNDMSSYLRYDPSSPYPKCQFDGTMQSVKLTPTQNADGTVTIAAVINTEVHTGQIPITATYKPLGASSCGLSCIATYNSDINPPTDMPVSFTVNLTIDTLHGDILAFDIGNVDDITMGIDPTEFSLTPDPTSCSSLGFICDSSNSNFMKQVLYQQLQTLVIDRLRNTIDGVRCVQCDPSSGCPTGSTCEPGLGICYYNHATHACPTNFLGMEGRLHLGSAVASFGGPANADLDISAIAGGRNTPGQAPSMRAENGGLQVGMLGGTHAPLVAPCVAGASYTPRGAPPPMDFDAESMLPGPGGDLSTYMIGVSLSDRFLSKALFDAYASGLICLDVAEENIPLLTSSLFNALLPNLNELTHGQNVPMLIALRPTESPKVVIGRGTTMADSSGGAPDPLLTVTLPKIHLEFYAFLEERYARLFTVEADLSLPLSLDADSYWGTITPTLGNIVTASVTAVHNEMNAADSTQIAGLIPALVNIIQPQLTSALQPLTLPTLQGYSIDVRGIRGSVKDPDGPGYSHVAVFADVYKSYYDTAQVKTTAKLVDSFVPGMPIRLSDAAAQPHAVIEAAGQGAHSLQFKGYEFSYRVDGGLWTDWNPESRFVVASPALQLQGRHDIEVRAREIGQSGTADRDSAHVPFVVDYAPPDVQFVVNDGRLTTVAHDAVTADGALLFRYRMAGRNWSEWGGAQTFALSSLGQMPSLQVEVRDEVGHVGQALYGTPVDAVTRPSVAVTTNAGSASQESCSQIGVGLWSLLGLVALRRRMRPHPRA